MRNAYSLGLSSFPLLTGETEIAAQVLTELRDFDAARSHIKEDNLFQRVRQSTTKVAVNEVLKRLKHADAWELETLAAAHDHSDSAFICMLLVSRQYPILLDIVTNLFLYKFEGRDYGLETFEIVSWYTALSDTHGEINELTDGSFKRLVINTKRILVEGGLLEQKTNETFGVMQPRVGYGIRAFYESKRSVDDLHMMLLTDHQIDKLRS